MKGYRKIIVMGVLIIVGVSFRLSGLINGTEMVELLKITGGAFFAANLVGKFSKKEK